MTSYLQERISQWQDSLVNATRFCTFSSFAAADCFLAGNQTAFKNAMNVCQTNTPRTCRQRNVCSRHCQEYSYFYFRRNRNSTHGQIWLSSWCLFTHAVIRPVYWGSMKTLDLEIQICRDEDLSIANEREVVWHDIRKTLIWQKKPPFKTNAAEILKLFIQFFLWLEDTQTAEEWKKSSDCLV